MKLSDYQGDEAFAVVADLLDPIARIVKSEGFRAAPVKCKLDLACAILKSDALAARELLAILNGVGAEQYQPTGDILMRDILEAVSDDAFARLFLLPGQRRDDRV